MNTSDEIKGELEEILNEFYLSGEDPKDIANKVYEYMLTFGKPRNTTNIKKENK